MTEEGPGFEPCEFGPYTLVSPLGEGGMAEVFLAVREGPMGFRKELAVKRIRTDLTRGDDKLVQYLINEARLGGQLRHPNVVDVYEFGTVADQHYIAMEFIHGLTLRALLRGANGKDARLPLGPVLDLGQQVCHGLEYAHELCSHEGEPLGLIHRDLKPANIIVSMAGQAKIMDFGIARSASAMFQTTTEDMHKGTLRYMSPEQLDDPRGIDHRSDLFALGAILFEALTGEILLDGPDNRSVMWTIISGKYTERLEALDRTLPEARPFIERALALDREARYADAEEMGADIRLLREELGLPMGCKELMNLIGARREGEGRFERVRERIIERDSRSDRDTGWPTFISSMGGGEGGAADPFHHESLAAGDVATLPSKIGTRRTEDLEHSELPATRPSAKPPAPPEVTPGVRAGGVPRKVPWIPLVLGTFLTVLIIVLAVWRPWGRAGVDPPDAQTAGVGAASVETLADAERAPESVVVDEPSEPISEEEFAEQVDPVVFEEPTPAPVVEEGATPEAETPTPEPVEAADLPSVRVVINAVPWASWHLTGASEARGAHTPYIGSLPPGSYRFVLTEGSGGESHEIVLEIRGDEGDISRCWNFSEDGPC